MLPAAALALCSCAAPPPDHAPPLPEVVTKLKLGMTRAAVQRVLQAYPANDVTVQTNQCENHEFAAKMNLALLLDGPMTLMSSCSFPPLEWRELKLPEGTLSLFFQKKPACNIKVDPNSIDSLFAYMESFQPRSTDKLAHLQFLSKNGWVTTIYTPPLRSPPRSAKKPPERSIAQQPKLL